jgi:glutaconate CoA-transferase subunit A
MPGMTPSGSSAGASGGRAPLPGEPLAPKLLTLADAVRQYVPDGASVILGTFVEQKTPFAAAHELIRQERSDLELIGPVADIIFDQLVGAGVVSRLRAAWMGLGMAGAAHGLKRAIHERYPRPIEVVDYSHLTLSLALTAAALGVPYLPTRTTLGTSLQQGNPGLSTYDPPVGDGPLVAVSALKADVALIPVQRSDVYGNSHNWGTYGVSVEAAHAARHVILLAEEIVSEETILSDPNRVIFPGLLVTAVVHEPWGCHPAPVQGFYNRDQDYYTDYTRSAQTKEGFDDWLYQHVTGVADRRGYLERIGSERLEGLKVREHVYAHPVDYGF